MTRLEKNPTWRRLRRIEAEAAAEEDLLLVHTAEHIRAVQRAASEGRSRVDADTYVTPASYAAGLDAVGCCLAAAREVVEGAAKRAFAAVRPPGHHATRSKAMGFCLFSNAAITARWLQRFAGLERVLVVDFDVHHGNGTQDIFYEDGDVAFMSVHQSPFYPGTGDALEQGSGDGLGRTTNVPMPSGTGDAAYDRIFSRLLRPIALRVDPEIIIVSAGYDAHWKDPLGGMRLTASGFAEVVREIVDWAETCCDGRLLALLEGGYHAEALAASVAATIDVLDDPEAGVVDPIGAPPGSDLDVSDYLDDLEAFLTSASP